MIIEDTPSQHASTERFHVFGGRLTRSTHDRIVAGLAGGIAARLGIPTVFVRAAFATLQEHEADHCQCDENVDYENYGYHCGPLYKRRAGALQLARAYITQNRPTARGTPYK